MGRTIKIISNLWDFPLFSVRQHILRQYLSDSIVINFLSALLSKNLKAYSVEERDHLNIDPQALSLTLGLNPL